MNILILYYSKTGHTLSAANAIANGVKKSGNNPTILQYTKFDINNINNYDAVIVGSPCWAGTMGHGIAFPLYKFLTTIDDSIISNKAIGAFAVHASTGGQNTVNSTIALFQSKQCKLLIPGPVGKAGTPLSIFKGKALSENCLKEMENYGVKFSDILSTSL